MQTTIKLNRCYTSCISIISNEQIENSVILHVSNKAVRTSTMNITTSISIQAQECSQLNSIQTVHLLGQVNEFTIISGRFSRFNLFRFLFLFFLSLFCLLQGFIRRSSFTYCKWCSDDAAGLLNFFRKCLMKSSYQLLVFSISLLNSI